MRSKNLILFTVSIIVLTSIVVYSADAAGIPKKAISTVARFLESDLPTTTVFTDQANTYTAGQKQTFQSSSTTAGLNFAGVSSDPSGVTAGDVWRNTASDALKVRGTSITQTIPTLENTETFTGTTTLNSLTLGGDANAGSHKITSLATPTSATDAARANTLQTKALATGTCSNGQYLAYQTSNSTWICTTLSALTSLNGDSTAAQTVAGTTGNVTVTNAGATHTINLGSNAVVNNLANTYTAGKKQTFQSSSTTAGVNLAGVVSNPSSLSAGDVWRNTSTDSLMLRGSSTYAVLSNHTFTQLYNPSNLVHAKSSSVTMLGLGGSSSTDPLSFTPTTTGRVLITFSSTILSATSAKPYTMQFSYGTGTAPTTGTTATGTTVGSAMIFSTPNNALATVGPLVSTSVLITGLTPGTTYWVDLRISDVNTSAITFANVQVTIDEI